ncbi:LysM peptidoglycan-binding domain-containing protein [Candidatus Riflebacteria bacterium]
MRNNKNRRFLRIRRSRKSKAGIDFPSFGRFRFNPRIHHVLVWGVLLIITTDIGASIYNHFFKLEDLKKSSGTHLSIAGDIKNNNYSNNLTRFKVSKPTFAEITPKVVEPWGAEKIAGKKYPRYGFLSRSLKKKSAKKTAGKEQHAFLYHKVKSGDNLTLISQKYRVSVSQLFQWNKLINNGVIFPGQKIKIKLSGFPEYKVKNGDNLSVLASQFNTTVEHLAKLNGKTKRKILLVGESLKLPINEKTIVLLPNYPTDTILKAGQREMETRAMVTRAEEKEDDVEPMQTKSGIVLPSRKRLEYLHALLKKKSWNSKSQNGPWVKEAKYSYYTVKKNDNLWTIAQKLNTRVSKLISLNKFRTSNIKPGQLIRVPAGSIYFPRFSFRYPLKNKFFVTSHYGWRKHPIFKTRKKFHSGSDFRASRGEIIHAAAAGMVTFSGWKRGYGRIITLEHRNGYTTQYAHCSRLLVKKDKYVAAGTPIAKAGSSGHTTGPHLHFEVLYRGKRLDPVLFFKKQSSINGMMLARK